jgi:rhamnulose-1-phosphate aldolase
MKSILEGRPDLAREINKVAEVAGYLWQKGWAERNGRRRFQSGICG